MSEEESIVIPTMPFDTAITLLKQGQKLARLTWNGKGMWVALQRPDENSKMNRPYLYIKIVCGELVPWCPSHSDLLGDDWFVFSVGA